MAGTHLADSLLLCRAPLSVRRLQDIEALTRAHLWQYCAEVRGGVALDPGAFGVLQKAIAARSTCLGPSIGGECKSEAVLAFLGGGLRMGRLPVACLVELVEVELEAGADLPGALTAVQGTWRAGAILCLESAPDALSCRDFKARGMTRESLVEVALSLQEVHAAVALQHLQWPVLRAVLLCFRGHRLRATFGLLREMCAAVFALAAEDLDLVAAVSAAPPGACSVDCAPWPIPHDLPGRESCDSDLAIVTLNELCEDGGDVCFPPYSAELEAAVEADLAQRGVDLQDAQSILTPSLTLPSILRLVASKGCTGALCGGALLWVWERAHATRANGQPTCCKSLSELSTVAVSKESLPWMSKESLPFLSDGGFASQDALPTTFGSEEVLPSLVPRTPARCSHVGSPTQEQLLEEEEEEDTNVDESGINEDGDVDKLQIDESENRLHPSPHEAFVACFAPELLQGREVCVSQINNLYRMRSEGFEIKYRTHGYARMCLFLTEVPGVEFIGSGNKMAVRVCDADGFAAYFEQVKASMQQKAAELRRGGEDPSALEVDYVQPKRVPEKLLARIWDIFQNAPDNQIQVSSFVSTYKERYRNETAHLNSLGLQGVRGLMAYVPFIEKVGSRGRATYVLKPGSQPPLLCCARGGTKGKGRGKGKGGAAGQKGGAKSQPFLSLRRP